MTQSDTCDEKFSIFMGVFVSELDEIVEGSVLDLTA